MALYQAWIRQLDRNTDLLQELDQSLRAEKKALLASDIPALKEASFQKERASKLLAQIELDIQELKTSTLSEFGLNAPEDITLADLFLSFEDEERDALIKKRTVLLNLSKNIAKLNQFNSKCLETFMSYATGVRSILSGARLDKAQTYGSTGKTDQSESGGRLVSRSL